MSEVSTKNLERTLGRKELFSIAIGQIIGAGIMALTGVAIGMTGRSVNLSFILASIFILILSIPIIFLGSTIRMRGGQYTQAAIFMGKSFAGMYIIIFILANISIAMYALSFADYFVAIIPGVNTKLVATIVLTLVFVTNYFGIKEAAKLQIFLLTVLVSAMIMFVLFGMPNIQPGYFTNPGFTTSGAVGVLTAGALLSFATGGATAVVNVGAEAKNPTKDIPFVMICSTLVVVIIYAFMATVAAGVLPIEEVANQPLTLVAKEILPAPLYIYFVVGGGMFALATTLNAQTGWVTKPVMQACVDGWFPKSLAELHPKHKTPYKLLGIFYLIGLIPILTGFNIEYIANMSMVLNLVALGIITVGVIKLPKLFAKQWEASPFKVKTSTFTFLIVLSVLVTIVQVLLLMASMDTTTVIGNLVFFVFAFAFGKIRSKKVDMEDSVEME